MAARSSKRSVRTEHRCLRRFRRRRLLAFLRHSNLPATFHALKRETPVFLDVPFLLRRVANGRWQEARGYLNSFLHRQDGDDDQILSDEADTALEFITRLNVFDDLAHDKLGCIDAADDLESRENWHQIRLKAAKVVKELVTQTPEFKHLLLLPRCPINPSYTIPFGFGGRWRHQRKNIGRMSASILARHFLPKERHQPSPWTQGLTSEPMDLCGLIGIPGAPVGSFIGKSCGISPANAVTKRLSEGCHAESVNSAKFSRITGEFCPDVLDAPSGGMDPMHVLNKITAMGNISNDIITLLTDGHASCSAHSMLCDKQMEQETLLHEL